MVHEPAEVGVQASEPIPWEFTTVWPALDTAPDTKPIVATWPAREGARKTISCCIPTMPLGVAMKAVLALAGAPALRPRPPPGPRWKPLPGSWIECA